MAYALITSGTAGGSPPSVTGLNTTGADFIIAGGNGYLSPSPNTITDNKSNTWTTLCNYTDASGLTCFVAYCQGSLSVGSGHNFTYNTGNANTSVWVVAFSGSAASPLDGTEAHDAFDGTPGTKTPSEDNCLVVTGISGSYVITAVACASPFDTTATLAGGGNTYWSSGYAYEIQTSATARSPSWSGTGANPNSSFVAVFKASAGGGGGPTVTYPMLERMTRGVERGILTGGGW
jgi:hypothetical protein